MPTLQDRWYEAAAREVDGGAPRPGLWSRAFAHADGDRDRAKACYIRLRVGELTRDHARAVREELAALRDALATRHPVVCPFCAALGPARREERDALARLFLGGPRYAHSCRACARSLDLRPAADAEPAVTAAALREAAGPDGGERRVRAVGVVALVAGVLSMALYPLVLIPLTAAGCGLVGLSTHDPTRHRGGWMSVVGLGLGTLYLIMGMTLGSNR